MNAEEIKHKERLNILEDKIGVDFYNTGQYHNAISDAMEEYHQSKLREELIEFADFIDDKVLEMVKVQRPIELVEEYLKQKQQ